jgi:hypothetical protein
MSERGERTARPSPWDVLSRTDVLAGLLLMAVAVFGLWASHDYPVGTALRMSTGYVPRLLCWILLGLGALILAAIAALVLIALCWAIFIFGLGLTIPVWPDW